MTESSEWVDVGAEAAFAKNRGRRIAVDGTFLAVWRTKDRWFAFDDACPHMGASLADGLVVGDTIQCPWHEWRYHVETGICPVRPWARVRVHEVRVEDGRVRVRRPERIEKPEAVAPEGESDDWMTWEVDRYFKKKPDGGQEPR